MKRKPKRAGKRERRYTYNEYLEKFTNHAERQRDEILRNGTPEQIAEILFAPAMETFRLAVKRIIKAAKGATNAEA